MLPFLMVTKRKLIKIGDGVGIILPKNLIARMNASVGDMLTATVAADGFELKKPDSNFDDQMAVARGVTAKRKQALSELT
jgi:antitoxin component of MazEF toxin-antitoxin module